MMVARLLSFWYGIFSGAMLNFQGGTKNKQLQAKIWKEDLRKLQMG